MIYDEKPTSKEKRDFKIKEIFSRITINQKYLTIAFQVNGFFYLTTGAVLGFYLKQDYNNNNLVYFLLLPILLGTVLGWVFIYGASLNKEASKIIEDIWKELNENADLNIGRIPDVNLLYILLYIFGVILLLVALSLILLPWIINAPVIKTDTIYTFAPIAGFIWVLGVSSSVYFAFTKKLKDENKKLKDENKNPKSFLETARLLKLKGPKDFSSRIDNCFYDGENRDDE